MGDRNRALPSDRATLASPRAPTGLGHSESVPSAVERAAKAIAANKRGLTPDNPEVERVWPSYCGQARAALAAAWNEQPASGLEAAIASFKSALPGYWFTVGECQVSADASCGPTRESPDIALIQKDRRFDDGFHADLPQPATMADALADVQAQAIEARSGQTEGLDPKGESAVPKGCAQ